MLDHVGDGIERDEHVALVLDVHDEVAVGEDLRAPQERASRMLTVWPGLFCQAAPAGPVCALGGAARS